MKSWLLIVVLALSVLVSCRKDSESSTSSLAENTWLYGTTTAQAAYSDLITKKGYQIVFHPQGFVGESQNLSFQFTARPLSASNFKPARDTFTADAVKITLRTDAFSAHYYSIGNDNTLVQATIKGGKLNLTGNNIRMRRDTVSAYADTTMLSFNLTEF